MADHQENKSPCQSFDGVFDKTVAHIQLIFPLVKVPYEATKAQDSQ